MSWVHNTLVVVLSDAEQDSAVWSPRSFSDTSVLLNTDPFNPFGFALSPPEGPGAVIMLGEPGGEFREESRSILQLVGPRVALYDLSSGEYHGPTSLLHLYIATSPSEVLPTEALTYIPAAFYIHELDLVRGTAHLMASLGRNLLDALGAVTKSNVGDTFARVRRSGRLQEHIRINKERGVLVLGSYADPYIQELRDVAARLVDLGYDAHLLGDLSDIAVQSNEEKLRMWAAVSRFAVMVDRVAGGHTAEYVYLREQRAVLGICRPQGQPSTFMIGDEPLVDINFFRLFSVPDGITAAFLMPEVAQWAEAFLAERAEAYTQAYPWRP